MKGERPVSRGQALGKRRLSDRDTKGIEEARIYIWGRQFLAEETAAERPSMGRELPVLKEEQVGQCVWSGIKGKKLEVNGTYLADLLCRCYASSLINFFFH